MTKYLRVEEYTPFTGLGHSILDPFDGTSVATGNLMGGEDIFSS